MKISIKRLLNDSEYRLVMGNILFSIFLKGGSMLLSLINTRLYILYFNNDLILGGWYAIVSILNWILYFDLGIGNGLRNEIVAPLEKKDYKTAKTYISTGYTVIGLISIGIIVVGSLLAGLLNWNHILNLPVTEVQNSVLIFMVITSIIGVGFQFFLKTIISIYHALRKTAVSGITALMTNLILFLYLRFSRPESPQIALISFAIVYAVATALPFLVVSVWAFTVKLKQVRPSIRHFDKTATKKITTLGMAFFVIQLGLLILSTADSWLITYFFQPEDVVSYQVYYRFFSIALTVYTLFSQTSWSSVTKYAAEKNTKRINTLYHFLILIACLGGLACLILAMNFKWIVSVWMGDAYTNISLVPALLFALWMTAQMIINASTAVANGLGKLKCQSIFVPLAGALKILGTIVLSRLGFNWTAVLLANIIGLIPFTVAQHIAIKLELKKLNTKTEE